MTSLRLDIIGNGFDRHHGIPSNYSDFGRYLQRTDPTTFRLIEAYFPVDEDFWSSFETSLAYFDTDAVLDHASNFLPSYGADDWRDSGHHDYEYEIDQIASGVSVVLRRRFADWIRQLPSPAVDTPHRLAIDPAANFLSFNYTPTLQAIYGVPRARILHIHGCAADVAEELILGHAWESNPHSQVSAIDEDTDVRVAGGLRRIDAYFRETFKPTAQIIAAHQAFFGALGDVAEIRVLGHSLSEVDAPYIEAVIDAVQPDRVRWQVSYHHDLAATRERFEPFGIASDLVAYRPLASFR